MTTFEKVIKYAATAFAAILAVSIVTAILRFGFIGLSSVIGTKPELHNTTETFESDEVKSILIKNNIADVEVISEKRSDVYIDAANVFEKFSCKITKNGLLEIKNTSSKGSFFKMFNTKPEIKVYIPEDIVFDVFTLDGGVGDINVSGITTNSLVIDGGVGDIDITDSTINKSDFDTGVGDLEIKKSEMHDITIDNGIGDIDLDIIGNIDDYRFDMDNGIGEIRINGKKTSHYSGSTGKYEVECDNGIGDVNINIEE